MFAKDTDILILLMHFRDSDMGLFITYKAKKCQTKKFLNIRKVPTMLVRCL